MIVLITGASHTGKTLLAQRTPEDDDALTEYLWPIVREMIKTAIENGQNLPRGGMTLMRNTFGQSGSCALP